MSEPHIQPRPGQPSGFFLLCFGRGGRERKGKEKGGGDQAGGSEESASRKNPGKQAGTSSDGALDVSNPSTRDTYLLLFFCLFLWMPCLYDYYYYYYHYYYSYSITTLVKEWI